MTIRPAAAPPLKILKKTEPQEHGTQKEDDSSEGGRGQGQPRGRYPNPKLEDLNQ